MFRKCGHMPKKLSWFCYRGPINLPAGLLTSLIFVGEYWRMRAPTFCRTLDSCLESFPGHRFSHLFPFFARFLLILQRIRFFHMFQFFSIPIGRRCGFSLQDATKSEGIFLFFFLFLPSIEGFVFYRIVISALPPKSSPLRIAGMMWGVPI